MLICEIRFALLYRKVFKIAPNSHGFVTFIITEGNRFNQQLRHSFVIGKLKSVSVFLLQQNK